MNKQLLTLVAALAVAGNVSAKNITVKNELNSGVEVTLNEYHRGGTGIQWAHGTHNFDFGFIEAGQEVTQNFDKTDRINVIKVTYRTADKKVVVVAKTARFNSDNVKLNLPGTLSIKEDGIYLNGELLEEASRTETAVAPAAAIVAALAAQAK